jgi:hypothetical protein
MTTSIEHEGSVSEGPATSLQIRRCQDGTVTWACVIPVVTADLDGFTTAVELAKQVDALVAERFGQRRTTPSVPRPRTRFAAG